MEVGDKWNRKFGQLKDNNVLLSNDTNDIF